MVYIHIDIDKTDVDINSFLICSLNICCEYTLEASKCTHSICIHRQARNNINTLS